MENQINYLKSAEDNRHFRELQKEVKTLVKQVSPKRIVYRKLAIFSIIAIYLLVYINAMYHVENTYLMVISYMILGMLSVINFISVIHDAVHNSIFKIKKINFLIRHVFDLMGGNSFIWEKRHMLLHHNFQNVAGLDSDIEQSGPIKIFPSDRTRSFHKYQHNIIFVFYPLFLLNWVFLRDFKDFFDKSRTIRKHCEIPLKEYFKLIFFKLFFVAYVIVFPILLGGAVGNVLLSTLLLLVAGSIVAMIFLLPPHANIGNDFPLPNEEGVLNHSWLQHQFSTTNDLKLSNWFTKYFMANFNFHLSHHMFPSINSIYAPEVTACIKAFATRYNFQYKSHGLWQALKMHYYLLKENGIQFNIFEEDM